LSAFPTTSAPQPEYSPRIPLAFNV
jgi:hypothetical protein